MKLTGTFTLTAAVNPARRTIVGQVVPFGEEGTPGLDGEGIRLIVEAGGLTWDDGALPLLRSTHHTQPIGRAVTLDEGPSGLVGTFKVAQTTAGDDALTLAAEGLQAGLSIEAEVPDGFTADSDGLFRLTADNPARLTAVALVDRPAFASSAVLEVAAAEVPYDQLQTAVDALPEVADTLAQNLPTDGGANQEGQPMPETATTAAEAVQPQVTAAAAPPINPTQVAATAVGREAFPYGHPGADGVSLFADIVAGAQGDSLAAARAAKAHTMMGQLRAGQTVGVSLTAANEPVVRSTLLIPNTYDVDHFAAQLKFPRVIADQIPGVGIDNPRPIVVPTFTSAVADGGSGEPVVASTEGSNPAQAELNVGSVTLTPVWYTGLYDAARQAIDAGAPGTDALIMGALLESYAQVTEAAAVTAILANGTAGTDVATNADTTNVEPTSAQIQIRKELAAMYANRGAPADAVLFASDVYQAAVGATNTTSGNALYPFMADSYQVSNQAAAAPNPARGVLNIYGVPGQLAFKLTATKFVVVKWADMIRYESPTYEFRLDTAQPASYRFAVGGYFVARTLQAKGVRYFTQL